MGMEPDPLEVPGNERIAWKLTHLDQWRNHIQTLPHYDHGYAYDITHEYGIDWTTDADYMLEVGRMHFNENGILTPQTNRHRTLLSEALHTLVESQAGNGLAVTAEPTKVIVGFTYPKSMIRTWPCWHGVHRPLGGIQGMPSTTYASTKEIPPPCW